MREMARPRPIYVQKDCLPLPQRHAPHAAPAPYCAPLFTRRNRFSRRLAAPRLAAPARARTAAPCLAAARWMSNGGDLTLNEDGVVVPELVETLEWVLDSPPPLHQFEESPIIVEIAGIEPAASR